MDQADPVESFSDILELEFSDELLPVDKPDRRYDPNTSYNVERFVDIQQLDPEWDDSMIEEIVVMSAKPAPRLPTILEESETPSHTQVTLSDFELLETEKETSIAGSLSCSYRPTGQVYAVRRIPSNGVSGCWRERVALERVASRDVPHTHRLLWTLDDSDFTYLILDNFEYSLGEVIQVDGVFTKEENQRLGHQILRGLEGLQSSNIVHGSLHPFNIMMDFYNKNIVLTDFRHTVIVDIPINQPSISTMSNPNLPYEYRAPEAILGWAMDFKADCWAFGATLFYMTYGKHPFTTDCLPLGSGKRLDQLVLTDPIRFFSGIEGEDLARDLISRCLERHPTFRASLEDIRDHEYFDDTWIHRRISTDDALRTTSQVQQDDATLADERSLTSSPTLSRYPSHRTFQSNDSLFTRPTHEAATPMPATDLHSPSELTLNSDVATRDAASVAPLSPFEDLESPEEPAMSPQDRILRFWDALDDDINTDPPIRSLEFRSPMDESEPEFPLRPTGKLRKRHSTQSLSQRFSSPDLKALRRKLSASNLLRRKSSQNDLVDLPQGVKQIGNGIGYSMPQAAKSKTSIFSLVMAPKGCLPPSALGLRLDLKRKPRKDEQTWIHSPMTDSTADSPGPPTPPPPTVINIVPRVEEGGGPDSTIRLVPTSPAIDTGDNVLSLSAFF